MALPATSGSLAIISKRHEWALDMATICRTGIPRITPRCCINGNAATRRFSRDQPVRIRRGACAAKLSYQMRRNSCLRKRELFVSLTKVFHCGSSTLKAAMSVIVVIPATLESLCDGVDVADAAVDIFNPFRESLFRCCFKVRRSAIQTQIISEADDGRWEVCNWNAVVSSQC